MQEKADAERNLKSLTDDFVSQNQELIALKGQLFDATNKAKMFETDSAQLNEVVRNLREELGRSKKVIAQSKQAKGMSLLQEENEGLQMQLSGLKDMLRQTMTELASLKDSSGGGGPAKSSGEGGGGNVRSLILSTIGFANLTCALLDLPCGLTFSPLCTQLNADEEEKLRNEVARLRGDVSRILAEKKAELEESRRLRKELHDLVRFASLS